MSAEIQFVIQIISASLCFVLVKAMLKPFEFTNESRYVGLPLGFTFLGIAEILLATGIVYNTQEIRVLSLITRTFAYVFLAATYYFSKKSTNNSHIIWNITFSLIIIIAVGLSIVTVNGSIMSNGPVNPSVAFRIIALVCILYILFNTLRSHIQNPEKDTLWISMGFILLGISQYSQLIWASDAHYTYGVAFTGGMIARLAGLSIFIGISYLTLNRRLKKL